jgi:hypothetical protein
MSQLDLFQPVSLSSYRKQEHIMEQTKPVQQQLPAITLKTIEQAIRLLNATGCKYKVIATDGQEFGELEIVRAPAKKKKQFGKLYPYGAMHKHYHPYLASLQVGDVACVPITPFDANSLQSSITGWASKHWGPKTYKTCVSNNEVQVLRVE